MILIVICHFLEINSEDSTAVLEPVPSKEKSKGSEKPKGVERDLASKEAEPVRETSRDPRERRRGYMGLGPGNWKGKGKTREYESCLSKQDVSNKENFGGVVMSWQGDRI